VDPLYEEIRHKPTQLMNEEELNLEQFHLRQELKRANKYLNRLIEKQLTINKVEA
jgi:Fe-S cluster biosynthesis and repair protein YggX